MQEGPGGIFLPLFIGVEDIARYCTKMHNVSLLSHLLSSDDL